jgi:DNA polymerase-3 subunit alpha
LHVRSQYSILTSSASVQKLVARAQEYHLPALALTDQGNLYGAVEFYKECRGAGIKPILGSELYVAVGSRFDKKKLPNQPPRGYPIVLLVKNKIGYKNLCQLSSKGFLEGFYYVPRIDKDLLQRHAEGLICLSCFVEGEIGSLILQDKEEELIREINWFKTLFEDDFFFEVQRHPIDPQKIAAYNIQKEPWLYQKMIDHVDKERKVESALKELAMQLEIPLVATNASRYLDPSDWRAHEILLNIGSGDPCEIWELDSQGSPKRRIPNPKRDTEPSLEYAFKSPEEMAELFHDLPDSLAVTHKIADACCFELELNSKFYPVFVPKELENREYTSQERLKAAEQFLRDLCEAAISKRYTEEALSKVAEKYPDRLPIETVRERLAYELDVIISKGMCDYLLIVYDFIAWAKAQGISMGPGRGSGAGSIVLYLIAITDIEPLRFNLFFERFINPERLSYPDIDVDICMERRQEVIDYVVGKYGKERVAQIITFGTMKARMAIKDVGRVLSVPLAKVNKITQLVPEDPGMTLEKAVEGDPELRTLAERDPEAKEIMELALKLEGSLRNTGIHAAGIIICGDYLTDHIPLCTAKDSTMAVTQFSMKPVESVGMLKVDFLGLKTLTSIQKTVDSIRENHDLLINWIDLPLDNHLAFDLLNQGRTLGVFQIEQGGMQELAKKLHIDRFEEIIAVLALYRPGPMEMIPSFIARKHGKEPIEIDHLWMEDILSETYGIMVYQEQVMQIARTLAGYTLAEGDVLRRAMGKKDHDEMSRQREKFKTGALAKGIDERTIIHIFDKIEKFASYGFNKSHAAAYGYLSYVTAYFKANFPREWMAALMTCDRDDVSKLSRLIGECRSLQIAVLPPDINQSGQEFRATPEGIRFAFAGIKGVGEGVTELVVTERKKSGPFIGLSEFLHRIDTGKIGKKTIEALIEAGAFDFTQIERQVLLAHLGQLYPQAAKNQKERALGILTLFPVEETLFFPLGSVASTDTRQSKLYSLKREKELLGFYLTSHPLDQYRARMAELSCVPLAQVWEMEHDAVFRTVFIIESIQIKLSVRSKRKFAILTVSDGDATEEVPIWSDMYEDKPLLFQENRLLYAVLQVDKREGISKLQCRWVDDFLELDEQAINAADLAYSRLKDSKEIFRRVPMKKKEAKNEQTLSLHLDLRIARLSHILELKRTFREHTGSCPVVICFVEDKEHKGELHIDGSWGVDLTAQLEREVKSIPSVIKFALQ